MSRRWGSEKTHKLTVCATREGYKRGWKYLTLAGRCGIIDVVFLYINFFMEGYEHGSG